MKSLLLFLFLTLIGEAFAQQKSSSKLEVLNFKSQFLSVYANGQKEDFGQELKIAFFKDHVLFEKPTLHLKGGEPIQIDFNNTNDGDTIIDESEPDMTIEKITYCYYVYKHGQQKGLFYNEETGKVKYFSVDTLFEQSNLGKSKQGFIDKDLGVPKEIRRVGKKIYEKYYGFKEADEIDTIFRHYDEGLKEINFSISEKLDQEKQSRLVKSLGTVNYKQSIEDKKNKLIKFGILDEIQLVTSKISEAQMQKFKRYFEKYQQDIVRLPITN